MRLIVDVGNTRAKFAVFDGDHIIDRGVVARRYSSGIVRQINGKYPIDAAIVTNTSDIGTELMSFLKSIPHFIHLDHYTPVPILNCYEDPAQLGKDRLAAAVGANAKFNGESSLIIDMGTCITMNLLFEGKFLGGNISPGLNMRLRAMHRFTAKLPVVSLGLPDEDLGTSTQRAMQNGAVKGAFREIEAFISEIHHKYGVINVILTGGDADMFANYTKNKIFVSPNLVLEGLNEILKYNDQTISGSSVPADLSD